MAELSESDDNPSGENGTATFNGIENGEYYLREVAVPTGYQLNPTEVMVLVADDAVYANAGDENDGVTVARGPGHLVATLSKFASEGDIDNTLSWIYEQMRISGASNTFSAYENEAWENWGYLKENNSGMIAGKGEDPLSIYLEYAPENSNSLFNYTVNRGRYKDGIADSIRRRLYTTVGWSYYELYQDVEYGETHRGNANYTKITNADGTPQEIANLFSRSTYVQVTDQKVDGDLEIRKIVKNAPQNDSTEYKFKVFLTDAKDASLESSYTYRIYNLVTTTEEVNGENVTKISREPEKDASGNAITRSIQSGETITLTDSQVAVIEKLPAGTRYTVEEVVSDTADYIISAVRDEGKVQVGSNTGTGEKSFDNKVTGTLYWSVTTDENGEEIIDTTSTVTYTNTYPSELTIHKVASGSPGNSLSGAEFVLYMYKEEGTEKQYYSYTEASPGSQQETSGKVTWEPITEDKDLEKYKLTTGSNGIIHLHEIHDGDYYLKELKAPDGYYLLKDEIKLTVQNGKLTGNYETTGIQISPSGLILTVPNRAGYKLPDTGGPGTLLYTLWGVVLLAGSLTYILYLRRKGGM